jgi:hypothetical protein
MEHLNHYQVHYIIDLYPINLDQEMPMNSIQLLYLIHLILIVYPILTQQYLLAVAVAVAVVVVVVVEFKFFSLCNVVDETFKPFVEALYN